MPRVATRTVDVAKALVQIIDVPVLLKKDEEEAEIEMRRRSVALIE